METYFFAKSSLIVPAPQTNLTKESNGNSSSPPPARLSPSTTMPGINAAVVAPPSRFVAFDDGDDDDDDDDGFGDFTFAVAPSFPTPPQHDADDWGEFVVSPAGSHDLASAASPLDFFDPFPSDTVPVAGDKISSRGAKLWEKPRGALPLSIFGEDEVEEPRTLETPVLFVPSFSPSNPAKDRKGLVGGGELKDLITSLYGQAPQPEGAVKADPLADEGKEDDSEESSWEFKDASSSSPSSVLEEVGMQSQKSGHFSIAAVDFSEMKVIRNGSDQQEANDWIGVGCSEQDVSYGISSGVGFISSSSSPMALNSHDKAKTAQNGDSWFSSLGDEMKRIKDERLGLDDILLENEVVTTSGQQSHEKQKLQAADSKVLGPTNETEVSSSLWESNLVDWTIPSYANYNEEGDERLFHVQNGFSLGPTSVVNTIKDTHSVSPYDLNRSTFDMFSQVDNGNAICPANDTTNKGQNSDMAKLSSIKVQRNHDLDGVQWELSKPSEIVGRIIDKNCSTQLAYDTISDVYCRLQDGLIRLLNCHLDDLKRAYDAASLSGDEVKAAEINEEMKVAYKKLEETKGSENGNSMEHLSVDSCVNQLLKIVEEPNIKAFEQEYLISDRIVSAGKTFREAIQFLDHTTSVLHILLLASQEEQQIYVRAWSDMAAICVEELWHGAIIWQESVQTQTFMQILVQEFKYFLALGEIYRVAEVLRASLKLYKPWILLNCGCSSNLLASLDKCTEAWTIFGLEEAVKTISGTNNCEPADLAKALLSSIKAIHDLSLSNVSFHHGNKICSFSLLSVEEVQDMKMVQWHGKYYFVKLANLWANRVSHEPPQLPSLHAG